MANPVAATFCFALSWIGLAGVAPSAPAQQPWDTTELEQQTRGFQEERWTDRLRTIAELLEPQRLGAARSALIAAIHGDHREYLARVEALLANLVHERWLEREKAERDLVELGSRARALLAERAQGAPLLEERIRVQRVLDAIAERGTEDEDRRLRQLRGYVAAALYLEPDDALCRALTSAAGHPDAAIVDGALRALGRHGGDDQVPIVVQRIVEPGGPHRFTALCALARMRGAAAATELARLVTEGKLSADERLQVLRIARNRGDGARPVLDALRTADEATVVAALSVKASAGDGVPVELLCADRSTLVGRFAGFAADSVVLEGVAEAPPRVEIPLSAVAVISIVDATAGNPPPARVFLMQGSLLAGQLSAIDQEQVAFRSLELGAVRLPRARVQGVLLDPDVERPLGAMVGTDRLRLRSGLLQECEVLTYAADRGLVVRGPDGERQVPAVDVGGLLFKKGRAQPDPRLYARLTARSGSRILADVVDASPAALAVLLVDPQLPGGPLAAASLQVSDLMQMELQVAGGATWGVTLIADYSENRVIEVDDKGRELFSVSDVFGAWDVESLDNGNLLLTEFTVSRVREITRDGRQVWAFEDLKNPYDADRLPDGNTLIADTFGFRVIEVNRRGQITWRFEGVTGEAGSNIRPFDADRLPNGNTLIVDAQGDRVIEVTREGHVVWQLDNLKNCYDADRLPNGNTLVTQRDLAGGFGRVMEVDRNGVAVSEIRNLNHPSDADRTPQGTTLVAESGMVREFDRNGNEIWRREVTWAVEVNRY